MHNLVIDARMIYSSGIGICLQNLIPLIRGNFNLILLGNPQDIGRNHWSHNLEIINVNSPIYSVNEQLELPLKIPKSDIFWSPHYNIPLLPIRAEKRLVTMHDVFHLAFFDTLSLTQKIYAKIVINSAAKLSDKIITISNFTKSEILKYIKVREDKIRVIYNGIDKNRFKICKNRSLLEEIKRKYNLLDNFILYVGNIKPHKNLKMLLNAFTNVYKYGIEDYYLVIVGKKEGFITEDREIFKILEKDTNLQGKVIFTGYVKSKDLPMLYNCASLFVFPSLCEGFGLPPLEAMACGCPVVVSNTASLPEVCGDAAYYVDPYDVESIDRGMYKVLTDETLRQDLIKKGLERVKLFSWEKSAKEHIKVFEEVLNS